MVEEFRVRFFMPALHNPAFAGNNPFTWQMYRKNYGILPICGLVLLDWCWIAFCTAKCFTRTDIVLTRNSFKSKRQDELHELLLHPINRKFLTFDQVFEPNPDLYATYQEMDKALKERQNC
ncbi:uncharacterized protein LOC132701543 [Cylas formicarius]|uniref:uncharacterized protein LOC132701543 n=1 Tax=Cylas formicarius TaxID=197179 RepID=UPI002958415D|nr:uncharacterized protein LOC132701543 [Cylas formicarius]